MLSLTVAEPRHASVCHVSVFFFALTRPSHIFTLSLHDALPIYNFSLFLGNNTTFFSRSRNDSVDRFIYFYHRNDLFIMTRSQEHTSELQSRGQPVCGRLR